MTHLDLSDDTFEHQFASLTLEPTLFSHEAHLRLAWIHIGKYGVEKAIENICEQIQVFDATFDEGTKYNATVTAGAVRAVYHFMQRSDANTFQTFIEQNPRLRYNLRDLLATHYSINIFKDAEAKQTILQPDLAPFN